MQPKIERNRSMRGNCDELADVRSVVGELVANEERRTASRMLAYDNVGRRVRKSGSWIRRLVGGYEVGLSRTTWRAIAAAYVAQCQRIEAEAEAARRRAALLTAQADELSGAPGLARERP